MHKQYLNAKCHRFFCEPHPLAGRGVSLNLWFMGLFLYTCGILCIVECCITQLWSSSIISYNATSISYNHHTDIYSSETYIYNLYACRCSSASPEAKGVLQSIQIQIKIQIKVQIKVKKGVEQEKHRGGHCEARIIRCLYEQESCEF